MKASLNPKRNVSARERADSLRLHPLAAVVMAVFAAGGMAQCSMANAAGTPAVEFDTTFLRTEPSQTVDLSRFGQGNPVSAGVYAVDVYINDTRAAREDVRFVAVGEGLGATPCLPRPLLEKWGVDVSKGEIGKAPPMVDACIDLPRVAPGASVDFDFTEQRLTLNVPQAYMLNAARGYVPPELWQDGVTAGFLNYSANSFRTSGSGFNSTQSYLGLNAGVNLGGWRLRHQSSVVQSSGQGTRFDNYATFLQHDVTFLKSQVTLGDSFTTGDVFDSVQFRGAQIASDDRMLPDSLRGYAPIVRGTADSNARVTIRQNNQIIYETSVSAGPFEIKDLYPTGYGGNLDVTVTEANGRTRSFSVPFASVAQSLRPGATRFSVTAGQLRKLNLDSNPSFAQFTVQRGMTNMLTAYGGGIAGSGYTAANIGAAVNTEFGAVSADVTGSQTQIPGKDTARGTSWRLGYNKFIDPTNTNIAVAAYRYSTADYLSHTDAAWARDLAAKGGDVTSLYRQKNRFQVTVNQNLGRSGSLFLSASAQQYWNRGGSDTFYQAGYANSFKYGTYSLTAGRTRNWDGSMSNQYMVSTTIPLGRAAQSPLLSTSLSRSGDSTNVQTNISGVLGEDNQYSYNAYGNHAMGDGSRSSNAGVSGTYRAPYAQVSASASGGSGSSQTSLGVSGSIVVHPGGVTLSQSVGDTFGIVEAPGAEGASVLNSPGTRINGQGYAVVPYLTPYGRNTVDIDPKGTSTDVEFQSTSEQATPRSGSVVMLKYKMASGRAALIRALQAGGQVLPFGADVVDANGLSVGVVAQDSQIFARGLEPKGELFVKWGAGETEQCRIDYVLPEPASSSRSAYLSIEANCKADG